MSADYRLTAFSVHSDDVRRVSLDRAWINALYREGFKLRNCDVGASVPVMSLALTKVEIARVNANARTAAEAEPTTGVVEGVDID